MKRKTIVCLCLALLMILSVVNWTPVYAEQEFFEGFKKDWAANLNIEDPNIPSEEPTEEEPKPVEEVVEAPTMERQEDAANSSSENAIELGEEIIGEPVSAPTGFDSSSINTIAKDKDGNFYGVRTYGNNFDTTSFKTFYKISEEQFNEVAKDCFMIFKRQDGKEFEIPYAKIGTNNIIDSQPSGTPAGPIFTEVQFRHHMAYRLGFIVNSDPTRFSGQEDLTWSITLKKDWVIEPRPDYANGGSPDYAYVFYNVEIDGKGHKIYRNDDESKGIFQLGSGLSGSTAKVRTATIKNLTIEGSGKYFGIDVSEKGILNLENVKIDNCHADSNHSYYGGAIRLNKEASLTMDANTIISNCSAERGGAIRLYGGNITLNINGSKFINNAAQIGGAICATDKTNTININGAKFEGNQAVAVNGGSQFFGGAIYSNSKLDIEDSEFKENASAQKGGAIMSFADISIKGVTFDQNEAADKGGAIYHVKGKLEVTKSNFTSNTGYVQGGAVFVGSNSKAAIKGTKFIGNKSRNGGGAVYIHWSNSNEAELANCDFIGNSSQYGGGLYVNVRSKAKVDQCNFRKNIAFNGAAIASGTYEAWLDDSCKLTINNSNFEENSALLGGGVFTAFPTEIKGSTFTKNEAQVLEDDDKSNPHKSGTGGALYVMHGETNIDSSIFTENNAYGSGGAISINGVNRDNNNPKNITSLKGGVKVNVKGGTVFENNYCLVGQGGAIHTIPYSYDLEDQTAQNANEFKTNAYKNLTTAEDTVFKGNWAMSGFFDPPTNYEDYTELKYKSNSFTEKYKDNILAKSLLNNFDVNFKNEKVTAYFDPNGGEFPNEAKPKDIKVIKKDKVKEDGKDKGVEITILQAPKRDGYKFLGWKATRYIPEEEFKLIKQIVENSKKPTDSKEAKEKAREVLSQGEIFYPGDKFTLFGNITFVAQWEKAKEEPKKEEPKLYFYFKPTKDLKDHAQYMLGYKDGTFRPNNKMSRQEVTVMLSRLLSERPQKGMIYSRDYKDVADNLWSVTAISYMSNLKMVKGYPDGNFRPYANITRAEFAAMVVRFENISAVGNKEFTDLQKDHWAYEVIQKAAQAGWISGYPDGTFRPDQPITRAEVVAITNRMLNRFADEDFVDHNLNKITNYTDIDKSHWAYYPVVEATNGHRYERKANGKDETWFEITGMTLVYDK